MQSGGGGEGAGDPVLFIASADGRILWVAGHEAEVEANQTALQAAGHWGVPTLVFDGEPFFGQDRIDTCVWRMRQNGLTRR